MVRAAFTRAYASSSCIGLLLLVALLCSGLVSACAVPVMHPFRTLDGFGGGLGFTAHVGAADERSCGNDQGCVPEQVGGISFLNVHGYYGKMVAKHVGIMGGLYLPGWVNSKVGAADISFDRVLASFLQVSVQNRYISGALGPELSGGIYGGTLGLDVQPWGEPRGKVRYWNAKECWLPSLRAYLRHLRPFVLERHPDGVDDRVPSWDIGVGARVGPLLLQYTYWRHTSGVMDYVIFETSVQASAWHIFLVSVLFDAKTIRLMK